jgi:hypothetical protein
MIGSIPIQFQGGFSMAQEPKDVLVRVYEDLEGALQKAPEDRR